MAAVLSNYGGFYTTIAYISEAMRLGLEVVGPDVNESRVAYTGLTHPGAVAAAEALARGETTLEELNLPGGRRGRLRVGLCQVGGLSPERAETIVAARETGGPFAGFDDLMNRVPLQPSEIEALIRCGALDSLEEGSRPELMWRALLRRRELARAGSGPALMLPLELPLPEALPEAPGYDAATVLAFEAETLDFLVSAHPLTLFEEAIGQARAGRGPPLIEGRDMERRIGERVRLVGWRVTAKPIHTIHNEVMEFVSFEDTTALYEVTVFPRQYKRFAPELMTRGPFILTGTVEEEWGAISLTLERLSVLGRGELPQAGEQTATGRRAASAG
jgi:DNA polymerase III alpha subunit